MTSIDVTTHNADRAGKRDSTASLAQAKAAAQAAGVQIHLPSGVYQIDPAFELPPNCTLGNDVRRIPPSL